MLLKSIIDKWKNLALPRVVRLAGLAMGCWLLSGPLLEASLCVREISTINRDGGAGADFSPATPRSERTRAGRNLMGEGQDASAPSRAEQEKLLSEAERLWKQGTTESRRRAIDKYNEALSRSNVRGDHRDDASTLTSIASIFVELGESRNALEYFNRALGAGENVYDPKAKADLLSNIA